MAKIIICIEKMQENIPESFNNLTIMNKFNRYNVNYLTIEFIKSA
jgi:hypothetical protein